MKTKSTELPSSLRNRTLPTALFSQWSLLPDALHQESSASPGTCPHQYSHCQSNHGVPWVVSKPLHHLTSAGFPSLQLSLVLQYSHSLYLACSAKSPFWAQMSAVKPPGRNKVRRLQLSIDEGGPSDPSGDGKPPVIPNSHTLWPQAPRGLNCAPP